MPRGYTGSRQDRIAPVAAALAENRPVTNPLFDKAVELMLETNVAKTQRQGWFQLRAHQGRKMKCALRRIIWPHSGESEFTFVIELDGDELIYHCRNAVAAYARPGAERMLAWQSDTKDVPTFYRGHLWSHQQVLAELTKRAVPVLRVDLGDAVVVEYTSSFRMTTRLWVPGRGTFWFRADDHKVRAYINAQLQAMVAWAAPLEIPLSAAQKLELRQAEHVHNKNIFPALQLAAAGKFQQSLIMLARSHSVYGIRKATGLPDGLVKMLSGAHRARLLLGGGVIMHPAKVTLGIIHLQRCSTGERVYAGLTAATPDTWLVPRVYPVRAAARRKGGKLARPAAAVARRACPAPADPVPAPSG